MDVSLDDYISKANFRVQIGNPNYKGPKTAANPGGFQLNKIVGPETKVTDVSITVPAVQKPPGLQLNRTNQVRDARERLIAKNKPLDARDKLIAKNKPLDARDKLVQKAQSTDARQKLTNIRARKAQSQGTGTAIVRTVANKADIRPGPVMFTRTLSRVMPQGYEDLQAPPLIPPLVEPAPHPAPFPPTQGPPQITRTVYTGPRQAPPPPGPPQQPPPLIQIQSAPVPIQYISPPVPANYPGGPPQLVYTHPPGVFPPPPHPGPPTQYAPPPGPQFAPPVPPQYVAAPAPPAHYVPPVETPGPPYPTEETVITRTVTQQVPGDDRITVPVVQVRNEQYQPIPPAPAPPYPTQEPPYPHREPPSPAYYPTPPPPLQRTIPNPAPPADIVSKTVDSGREPAAGKRRPLGGPLKLSSSGTVPVVDLAGTRPDTGLYRYRKGGATDEPPVKKPREEVTAKPAPVRPAPAKTAAQVDEDSDVISPLQGYKVQVTNLHISVSHDDIIELFGALGAVKKVRLVKPGLAEVSYVRREDAVSAQTTYHNRELDGLPMVVKIATPASARIRQVPETLPPSVKPATTGPLKLNKKPAGMARVSDNKSVDVDTLHKALFKTASSTPSKPVTFTVNI